MAAKLSSPSSYSCNKTKQKEGDDNCRTLLPSKKNQSKVVVAFFLFLLQQNKNGKKAAVPFCLPRKPRDAVAFFFFLLQQNKEKKATAASRRLLRGATSKK